MQMYEELPIITNKIPLEERKGTPHHLLACVGLEEEPWRVGLFRKKALNIIKEIRERGRLPILVGGTHYYTQALLFDNGIIDDNNELHEEEGLTSVETRKKWPILDGPTEGIIAELRAVDPVMADRWHPKDRRKIRRSLEIWLQYGRKASDIYQEQQARKLNHTMSDNVDPQDLEMESIRDKARLQEQSEPLIFWTHASTDILNERLEKRVDGMLSNGLLSEVNSMDQFHRQQVMKGRAVDKTSGIWVSIGYKEFEEYNMALNSGNSNEKTLEALKLKAIEKTKTANRQYAKRQVKWIRIKLMHAVQDAGLTGNMFLLDGTDLGRWSEDVDQPAIQLTKAYLEGTHLPDPKSLSEAAREALTSRTEFDMSNRRDLWVQRTCDVCGTTVITEDAWSQHVRGRRHKRAVRSHENKALRRTVETEEDVAGSCDDQPSPT